MNHAEFVPRRSGTARRLLMLAAILAFGLTPLRADEAADEYNLAVSFYKRMKWSDASRQFESFLKNFPAHEKAPLSRFYLGLTYVNQDDYQKAREALRDFLKAQPSGPYSAQARYRVAECSYLLDDLKAAEPELKEFIEQHADDPLVERALPYLGDVQLRQGEEEAALATFDRALKEFPTGVLIDDARFGRAKSLEFLKRTDEALQQYQAIAGDQESPRASDAQFQIAAIQFELKNYAEATTSYLELLQRFPKSPLGAAARLNAGYGLYQQGKFAEAAQQFAIAQKDPQNYLLATYWRGLSLKSLGDVKQASSVLADAAKEAEDHPLAESIQFQRGLCARQLGDAAAAMDFFTKGAERWPDGEYADDCLHAAAELAVDAGDIPAATQLLARFAKEHPGSGLRMHYDLLMGRIDLAKATANIKDGKSPDADYRLAGKKFEKVLTESTVPRTQMLARYYLGLTRQLQNRHEEALNVLAPLTDGVIADGAQSEFGDALVIQADSRLALKEFDAAQLSAEKYLSLYPEGRQVPRALYVSAVASANLGDSPASNAALDRLTKDFPQHALTPAALLQLAELAESQKDWPTSEARYSALAGISDGSENQAFAIRGMAWSLFKQEKFAEAARQFQQVIKRFPDHMLISECSYYFAESLREAGQLEDAAKAYAVTFERFSPPAPAQPESEGQAPLLYAYRAGLQRARTLRQLEQIAEADEAYAALVQKFPRPQQYDKLLNEWALMNYVAENYAQADTIFRRLVDEAPNSDLADDAMLSLAESDLLADKLDEAKQAFEKLASSPQSDAEVKERALYQLIVLAVHQERWEDAQTVSRRLEQEFPESPHVSYAEYSQAEAILNAPKSDGAALGTAKQKLDKIIESAPKDLPKDAFQGRAWVLRAELAFREKDYSTVYQLADQFKQEHPESIFQYQIAEIVGRSYKQEAKFPEAREALERVLNDKLAYRTPTAAKSQILIGDTYLIQEDWEKAYLAYQKVYANYDLPEWQAPALLQSGKCEEQMNKWKEAAKTYQDLIREFPQSEFVEEAKKRLEIAKSRAGAS